MTVPLLYFRLSVEASKFVDFKNRVRGVGERLRRGLLSRTTQKRSVVLNSDVEVVNSAISFEDGK